MDKRTAPETCKELLLMMRELRPNCKWSSSWEVGHHDKIIFMIKEV